MKRARSLAFLLLIATSGFGGLFADEGRIPIAAPTTILGPGSYVVTRDISVSSGSAITIQASQVTIDLNGRTLTSTSGIDPVIAVPDGSDHISIANGRLVGGSTGIAAVSTTGVVLRLESLEVVGAATDAIQVVGGLSVDVSRCTVRHVGASGLYATGQSPGGALPLSARLVGNAFTDLAGYGIVLAGARNSEIRGNILTRVRANGIQVEGPDAGANLIVENAVTGVLALGPQVGIVVDFGSSNNLVLNNAVRDFANGILVWSNGNRLAGNVVGGSVVNGQLTGNALYVIGSRTLIEGNHLEGNAACGIFFGTASHAYRNNMLRGNVGGGVCGTANTDAGGNIL